MHARYATPTARPLELFSPFPFFFPHFFVEFLWQAPTPWPEVKKKKQPYVGAIIIIMIIMRKLQNFAAAEQGATLRENACHTLINPKKKKHSSFTIAGTFWKSQKYNR